MEEADVVCSAHVRVDDLLCANSRNISILCLVKCTSQNKDEAGTTPHSIRISEKSPPATDPRHSSGSHRNSTNNQ